MGSQNTGEVDRRSKAHEKLDALVQSRTETLSLLTDLAARQPFNTEPSMEKALRRFCEALIDYTARVSLRAVTRASSFSRDFCRRSAHSGNCEPMHFSLSF